MSDARGGGLSGGALVSRSPLDERLAVGGRDGADGRRTLRLTEIHGTYLVQVGTFPGGEAAVGDAVRAATGAGLPESSTEVAVAGPHRLYRIASDQVWIATTRPQIVPALAHTVPPTAGTVTELSAVRVRLAIEGSAAAELLAQFVAIDLDAGAFPAGRFVLTGIHDAGVLLERIRPDRFEIRVLRSFAAATWDVLVDAALAYGYDAPA